ATGRWTVIAAVHRPNAFRRRSMVRAAPVHRPRSLEAMSPALIPLVLVALGSAGLVLLREGRAVLGALALQWLGMAWAEAERVGSGPTEILGMGRNAAVELVTAVACGAVLWITLQRLHRFGFRTPWDFGYPLGVRSPDLQNPN